MPTAKIGLLIRIVYTPLKHIIKRSLNMMTLDLLMKNLAQISEDIFAMLIEQN